MAGSSNAVGFALSQQSLYYLFWQRWEEFLNQVPNQNQCYEPYNYYSNWGYNCLANYSSCGFMPCGIALNPSPAPEEMSAWPSPFSQETWISIASDAQEPVIGYIRSRKHVRESMGRWMIKEQNWHSGRIRPVEEIELFALVFTEDVRDLHEPEMVFKDPDIYLNVEELNGILVARSEDLYDSLISCQWQPLDSVTSKIPTAG
uniref:tRNA selenocysteine 1-associated protein 1 C-terminal domain-containing protein n=1 Tax=Geotrypetes seraphini TaxID=260995 RepID=A0A6P8Q1L4_GEOSA|nr:putative uncharacterized protein C6orf52 homolog isoform X2 [Geotrypetes seraphini]